MVRWALTFLRTAAAKALRAATERRLPLSPSTWLRDLALHWGELREHGVPEEPARNTRSRAVSHAQARAALEQFLASDEKLTWAPAGAAVSVVIPLYNRAELTLGALRALPRDGIEVIVVDNASTDRTSLLLERLSGVRVLRNRRNEGFLKAVNQGAELARGDALLFLNSDATLQPESLMAGLEALESAPEIAAVGGKLIHPDDTLQEAGSIIWRDGWCQGYGRGAAPDAAPYNFRRDVDYCSAACLLIRREDFAVVGGFDERYRPAYYEDVDLCVRLWRRGRRVVYEPRMVAHHVEFGSGSAALAAALQAERHALFVAAHADWLAAQPERRQGVLVARSRPARGPRVLTIDDRVPLRRFGSGAPRAASLLDCLVDAGCGVTVHPTAFASPARPTMADGLPATVEVLAGGEGPALDQTLRERLAVTDRIIVSRPTNLLRLEEALRRVGKWPSPVPIIYDAEAVGAMRDAGRLALLGQRANSRLVEHELALLARADTVLAVSEAERALFEAAGARRVLTLGHSLRCSASPRPFAERSGLLFVGAFYEPGSPNTDSILWFCRAIWPRLRVRLRAPHLTVVGARPGRAIRALASAEIDIRGSLAELGPLYDAARVFIAPTRFAAGIPHKVHEAAAVGLPVVATSLLAAQLGWRAGEELSVADDAAGFAAAVARLYEDDALWQRQREAALAAVARDCDPARFRKTIDEALHLT